ncbi:MAG TPA: hypothetical protein VKP65_01030, partial [Rhodothermales bacterium]|nr:hypothetical protein [Rhodothermales bacterium]
MKTGFYVCLVACFAFVAGGCTSDAPDDTEPEGVTALTPAMTSQDSGSEVLFIGLSPVDENV